MLFGPQGKRVHVDTSVRCAGVVLERLNHVKVRAFALRETVLAIELELGSHHGVLTPAVHVKSRLGQHERASIRDERTRGISLVGIKHTRCGVPLITGGNTGDITGTGHLEETIGGNECVGSNGLGGSTESVDGIGKSIDGIRVVEGLSTKGLVEDIATLEGRAIINVGIGLNNPDELLARVVKVQLDLVGRRSDRLITRELELLNEVLVGVLGHLAALIRVQEDVVNVQGGSNKGLLVSLGDRDCAAGRADGGDSPQALTNGAEIDVDLDFVILYESLIPVLSNYLRRET